MLQDRDYMRGPSFDSRRSLTVSLIFLLLALFVVQACLMFYTRLPVLDWFALSLDGIKQGRVWQLLTFQFLHSYPWPWHVLLNCLGLYFFGRSVEETLGRRKFLALYLISGFVGGLTQLAVTSLLPHHQDFPVVGASAGVMGLVAAFATLYPLREITTVIYFFPVTIRAHYIFWFLLLISAFGTLVPYSNVADAAHLGGLLAGVAYIRWDSNPNRTRIWQRSGSRQRKIELIKAATAGPRRPGRSKKQPLVDLPSEEFIEREVDPILDKISAHGIQSLTERERAILQAARNKMSKR